MRRILLLFSIFTCLYAASSTDACAQEPVRDSLLLQAAKCERIVYDAPGPREVNEALLQKAECYKQAGLYKEASATLERVSMYMVRPDERKSVVEQKALCAFLGGDYDSAMSYLEEVGIDCGYVQPKLKNEWVAMALTFLVPAGYLYVNAPLEGAVSTLLNAASIAWAISQVSSGLYVVGIAGGCLALSETYLGAQARVASLMEERNSETVRKAKCDAIGNALLGLF